MIAFILMALGALPTAVPVYCSDRVQKYIEYNALFEHYAALEQWKWKNVYDVDDAVNLPYLWDDFLIEAPYDPPHFNRTMTTLHKLIEHGVPEFLVSELLCALEDVEYAYDTYDELFDEYFNDFWNTDNNDRLSNFLI